MKHSYSSPWTGLAIEREFFIDNLLVRIHFTIVMIWWTGLAPWDLEFPFPGILASTLLLSIHPQPSTLTNLPSNLKPRLYTIIPNPGIFKLSALCPHLHGYVSH